jgi:Fe-S-cluster-containing hydrogenase component 2
MIVDHEKCIGCGDCVRTCPKNVIYLNRERKSVICDLCGGSPKCAEWCPKEVISYKEEVAS